MVGRWCIYVGRLVPQRTRPVMYVHMYALRSRYIKHILVCYEFCLISELESKCDGKLGMYVEHVVAICTLPHMRALTHAYTCIGTHVMLTYACMYIGIHAHTHTHTHTHTH